MKTLIQELIECLPAYIATNGIPSKDSIGWKEIEERFLEKEKQMIIDAWKNGAHNYDVFSITEGFEYYTETFKQ